MRKGFLFLFLVCCQLLLWATHQRAGEITYEYVSGLTYRFTIITYTYTPSAADRPQLDINWGDGITATIARTSRVNLPNDITRNTYVIEHTFPSTGNYHITLEDANRNNGIVNIPNSVNVPFFLETTLIINPFIGSNSSPQLLNPPIDNGCIGYPYYHNPGAFDSDGDSLSFQLITCRGYNGENIPGYSFPAASQSLTLDAVTGDLIWDSPTMQGEYNIAILVNEWRNGVCIGSVVRDMQITILSCQNQPPQITTANDTCITAGESIQFDVVGNDANSSSVTLTATGGVFQLHNSPATFTTIQGAPPVTSQFQWNTECSHVRLRSYSALFKATDNGPQVNLTAYKTLNITVVAPKPENVTANALGNHIHVAWSKHTCAQVKGYRIYRRNGNYNFTSAACETGLPAYTGYQLIGTTQHVNDTTFMDDGTALPLYHGNDYCYRVVAFFADGAQSYASDEACATLHNDVPQLTHADITATDPTTGNIFICWLQPRELDTQQFPGPNYEYRIYRASSQNPTYQLIATNYHLPDTIFYDNNLNTKDLTYYYRICLFAEVGNEMVEVGYSDAASSVHLRLTPADRALQLEWQETVPWQNYQYTIYRWNEPIHQFDSIATTSTTRFTDVNLVNGQSYCYYVAAHGRYVAPDTIGIFHNRSQEACAVPADLTPPETPQITITTDCESVELQWSFTNDSAHQDIAQYYIYYRPTYHAPTIIIDSFQLEESCYPSSCYHQLTNLPYITGCFSLGSTDTAGNIALPTEPTCFDTDACSPYQLPNIITPNGDGTNDELVPFPYHNVQGVDFYLYNRWGRLVFKTNDIDIHWDGTDMTTHRPASDGTYFYVCQVHLYTLTGIMTIELHGTVTVIR